MQAGGVADADRGHLRRVRAVVVQFLVGGNARAQHAPRLADDRPLEASLAEGASRSAVEFPSIEDQVRQTTSVYDEVLREKATGLRHAFDDGDGAADGGDSAAAAARRKDQRALARLCGMARAKRGSDDDVELLESAYMDELPPIVRENLRDELNRSGIDDGYAILLMCGAPVAVALARARLAIARPDRPSRAQGTRRRSSRM